MDFFIDKIVLWPRDTTLAAREIKFVRNKVNVITGQSRAGKSAIIPIIDYCLGSGKCAIPVGVIRDTTQWFEVKIQLSHGQLIIARRNPDDQDSTGDVYIDEGTEVSLPRRPERNANVDFLVTRLNQICGIPSLDFRAGKGPSGFRERPSFRDLAAFNFQTQHIVANPYALFFKADSFEHREKLKTIFPLVLGAVTPDSLELQHKLRDLERQAEEKEELIKTKQARSQAWLPTLIGLYQRAREFGLLPQSTDPDSSWTLEQYVNRLVSAIDVAQQHSALALNERNTERAVSVINDLLVEEQDASHNLGLARLKLNSLEQLRNSTARYEQVLQSQTSRLSTVG